MTTEQELKDQCTPEFIKWMCKLAEGFEYDEFIDNKNRLRSVRYENNEMWADNYFISKWYLFPLLIHRAVEGWNKIQEDYLKEIIVYGDSVKLIEYKESRQSGFDPFATIIKKFKNYQPQSLTQAECACLHCLLDIFKEERG